ncbi:MAG: DUF58 domain-containing protein [Deltaproteobacteria bacterium]|nr:DUF58 domain-containing protein [Deltaproteobacteria bacterium]
MNAAIEKKPHQTISNPVKNQLHSLVAISQLAQQIDLPSFHIKSQHKGSLLSKFKGRGVELTENRPYEDGDDVRDLNWQVYAKTGRLHTKVYQEERERPVYLWVDVGPSMQFATQGSFKSVVASHLASLVGWYELKRHNRVGGVIASANSVSFFKAGKNRKNFLRFLHTLCLDKYGQDKQSSQTLYEKLKVLERVKQPGTAMFLFGDFLGWDQTCKKHIIRLSKHQDITLTIVLDPIELNLPSDGTYAFSNGHEQTLLDLSQKKILENYYSAIKNRIHDIRSLATYPNINTMMVFSNDHPLQKAFQKSEQIQNIFPKEGA